MIDKSRRKTDALRAFRADPYDEMTNLVPRSRLRLEFLSRPQVFLAYGLMIAGTVALFLLIRNLSVLLPAPSVLASPSFGTQRSGAQQVDTLLHVLLALFTIIITARALGLAFKRLHQPLVIGEVVAGLVLGPSVLGHVAPGVSAFLLPSPVTPYVGVLSQVGVILYMFLVGLELDPDVFKRDTHTSLLVSQASISVPFVCGSALALWIYPRLSTRDVPFTYFALFMGVSMSVTAFPVLARILQDRGMHRTPLGVTALTCAAVSDVTAWCLLAVTVSVVQARASGAVATIALTLAYIFFVLFIIRPGITRLAGGVDKRGQIGPTAITAVLGALLLSALTTEAIGIHAIFGAFLAGVVIPQKSMIARELTHRLEDTVVVLLLPAFFAFTGMRTQIGLLDGMEQWLLCGMIILVACLGKFGGTTVAARMTGTSWRDASALGILMNTRGLMELIVLNIGLDLGVVSPRLFAMLVLMAVVTTIATTPILHWLTRSRRDSRQSVDAGAGEQIRDHDDRSSLTGVV